MGNPFAGLLRSRKFWTLVMDLIVSMVLYFGAKYLLPVVFEDVKFVVAALQPVFLFLIAAIAYEDGKALAAGTHVRQMVVLERSADE